MTREGTVDKDHPVAQLVPFFFIIPSLAPSFVKSAKNEGMQRKLRKSAPASWRWVGGAGGAWLQPTSPSTWRTVAFQLCCP